MRPAVTSYLSSFTDVSVGRGFERQQLSWTCVGSSVSRFPHVTMPAVALPTVPLHERPATHLLAMLQNVDLQSASTLQGPSSAQPGAFVGAPPPQSTPVSVPFLRPSLDVGALHVAAPTLQRTFAQSASPPQPCPGGQRFGAVGPPQS